MLIFPLRAYALKSDTVKSGITHSLDFPVDIDEDVPPALDVLISSCRPHSPSGLEDFSQHESLFYPPKLNSRSFIVVLIASILLSKVSAFSWLAAILCCNN